MREQRGRPARLPYSSCLQSPDMASCFFPNRPGHMETLLEYVGNVHIYLGPYRGNPIALYLRRHDDRCVISPKVYPWNQVVGTGETSNKAAADFEEKWKAKGLSPEMYTGPSWEGGIKPERPAPPKPAAAAPGAAKPAAPPKPTGTEAVPGGERVPATPSGPAAPSMPEPASVVEAAAASQSGEPAPANPATEPGSGQAAPAVKPLTPTEPAGGETARVAKGVPRVIVQKPGSSPSAGTASAPTTPPKPLGDPATENVAAQPPAEANPVRAPAAAEPDPAGAAAPPNPPGTGSQVSGNAPPATESRQRPEQRGMADSSADTPPD
jgi:hypothetical protein